MRRNDLPSGSVTFLFTDVEGSTKLLDEIGDEAYDEALAEHRRVVRAACAATGGVEVDTQGDAFFFAFPTAPGALAAAVQMTAALASGPIQVRIGLHTGEPRLGEEGYVGKEVHVAARVAATGHGGQIVLSKTTAQLVDGSLTDLGEHRLKDIEGPVAIFQLGNESFPPLKTISNTNLPRPASSFVGRERELEEVLAKIDQGTRLLTLTGPGGSGKTRLALEASATLVPSYKAGVFWVGLSALRDPALVIETIAQTLGSKNGLAEHIGERELLLLLDNLEQVIEAASELSALLQTCPNLTLLCTSRELLRVQGEVEYAVPPLAEPEALTLFCERAQLESSAEIGELCDRLDNLPLAVELAAARTKALTPSQILERLSSRLDLLKGGRDADPRQQTLRATIEWSHDLLSEEEQRLFRALSVFAGGCTLEAAEEVCDADLDTLQSLVEKSLLRFSNERYWPLETIREYAGERLDEAGEAEEIRRRHADYFLTLAEEAGAQDLRWNPGDWLERLDREHDNLRAAIDRLEAWGDSEGVMRLAAALWRFWQLRNHREEGRTRLERALRADTRPTPARAKALDGAAVMAVESGDGATGKLRAEEALALHQTFGDRWGEAFSAFMLGNAASDAGEFQRAARLYETSVGGFREVGDENYTLLATRFLAAMYERLGEKELALALHDDTLQRARALGNLEMEEELLGTLAGYAVEAGRFDDALSMLKHALRIARELENPVEIAHTLRRFAFALVSLGRVATATRLLAASESLRHEIAFRTSWFAELSDEELAPIRSQLDEASFAEAWDVGLQMTVDEAVALALGEADTDA